MITLDDDQVLSHITGMFGTSEPGAQLHHLMMVRQDRTPLGVPEPKLYVWAIAPCYDNAHESEAFTLRTIVASMADPEIVHLPALLTVLLMEVVQVLKEDLVNEVDENRARVLYGDGKLDEHAKAVEMTVLYAATPDGRRWTGRHWLTGRRAGEIVGPTRWDRGSRSTMDGGPFARAVRMTVGLSW